GYHSAGNPQRHVQLSVATDDEAGLCGEENDPGRHQNPMEKYERNDLLGDWCSGVGPSVKIKLLESHGDDDEQEASSKEIKYALYPLLVDGSPSRNCHCARRTHHCASLGCEISLAETVFQSQTRLEDFARPNLLWITSRVNVCL